MAIATQASLSKKSPNSSSKFKQRKALEAKKRLLQKRPTDLKYKAKKVTFDIPSKSIVSYDPKVATNANPPDSEEKSSAMNRAQEVQASLSSEFPSFIKPMLPSHVRGGFWLSFPKSFCDLNLPKHDDTVVLVDENDQEFETKYLIDKNGLSGGWRGFSIAHKLLEGDALVFQLITPCKFKVYIVRVNSLTEIDGAISLLQLDARAKPMDFCQTEKDVKINHGTMEALVLASIDLHQENVEEKGAMIISDQSGNDSDDLGSEVLEGIRFSQSVVDLKDVKGTKDFNIVVDGLVIDSEIPKHLRIKYYDLCCTQNSYLHEHLLKGLNVKLAAGIISETVNIADAIRACKLTTSRDDFEIWDKTLKAFEEMGMKVGFLRARIVKLVSLSYESQEVLEAKRLEQVKVEEEKRIIMEKLFGVREVIKNLASEIETLKLNGERLEPVFQKEASAPW